MGNSGLPRQLDLQISDCFVWGRAVRSYEGAVGNGRLGDDDATNLTSAGNMWLTVPIERWQFLEIYQSSFCKPGPDNLLGQTSDEDYIAAGMRCAKFSRGLFKGSAFVSGLYLSSGPKKYEYVRQCTAGFLGARHLHDIFRQFDSWLEATFPPTLTFESALSIGGAR